MNTPLTLVSDRKPDEPSQRSEEIPFATPQRTLRERRRSGRLRRSTDPEEGAVTAEYAVVILAAVAFAGVLVAIMRSSEIRAALVQLVENALGAGG